MPRKIRLCCLVLVFVSAEAGVADPLDPVTDAAQLETALQVVCNDLATDLADVDKNAAAIWLGSWEQDCGTSAAGQAKKEGCADWIVTTSNRHLREVAAGTLRRHNALLARVAQVDDPTRIGRLQFHWRQAVSLTVSRISSDFNARLQSLTEDLKDVSKEDLLQSIELIAGLTAQQAKPVCNQQITSSMVEAFNRPEKTVREDSERQHFQDLQKSQGFSSNVRCQWKRGTPDFIECSPGLRISAQTAGTVVLDGPTDSPGFSFGRIIVQSGEVQGPRNKEEDGESQINASRRCPGTSDLSCDMIDFSLRSLPRGSVIASVHKGRRFGDTTFNCYGLRKKNACAARNLRGADREKLSILVGGNTTAIHLVAEDAATGDTASGTILLGYERWRFETGGFLALTKLASEEIVTEPAGDGMVTVTDVRSADDYESDTGIFTNFVPSNYEAVGLGLGFATADDSRLTIFIGPSIRFRTFGDRGIAAITAGWLFKPVRRFPDLELDGQVYSVDDRRLDGELRTRSGGFIGIQLGFSFGPIGASD